MTSRVLSEGWRLAPADDTLRRTFIQGDFDDSAWAPTAVPGHWQQHEDLADTAGPMLYRCSFHEPALTDGRAWLAFDGIHYAGDVWFDGEYLGATEGYFVPHEFEITDRVADGGRHTIAVEVLSPRTTPGESVRNLTGIFDDHETLGPLSNAGGIWAPVRLVATGPVRLWKMRTLVASATADEARVSIRGYLRSDTARDVEVVTTLLPPGGAAPITHRRPHHLAAGDTVVEWDVPVHQPELWWPHALGDQPIYRLQVAVITDPQGDPSTSDLYETTLGLRSVSMKDFVVTVNGQRLVTKGVNVWPTRALPAAAASDEIEADVWRARELGLDLLRVRGYVARRELYEAADRAGLLIWQDLPLRGRAARGIRQKAVEQAYRLVDHLGNHPSIAIWCGHDDPTGTSRSADPNVVAGRPTLRRILLQEAPTWNKTVLDRDLARAFDAADGTRPVVAHSGVWPNPPRFDGTDAQLWFGWAGGTGRDLTALARRIPRVVRWVSAFGAQSVPTDGRGLTIGPDRWPHLDWDDLHRRYGLDRSAFERYVWPHNHVDFEAWALATQDYQATLLRRQIESLRRLKYRPTGGFSFAALADSRPAVSFAILDHERRPKIAFEAVKAACRPVIVVADRMPVELNPGDPLAIDVHVVNDTRLALEAHTLQATMTWADGERTWVFSGRVGADDVARIATLNWTVPNAQGPVRLELLLESDGQRVTTNRYGSRIGE